MIRSIRGHVAGVDSSDVVVEVGGLGYLIHTNAIGIALGEEVLFYTHLAVRENAHDLYGFVSEAELNIFELLIELPKIGPKTALQFLKQADIRLLKEAVRKDDPKYLSKLSGIGKKSAEKIVAGLREKFEAEGLNDELEQSSRANDRGHAPDTVDALIALGYSEREARVAVKRVSLDHPEVTNSAEALKIALRELGS